MAKSILKVSSTKLSNDIDDYLSDDFTDEDLTPPDEDGIKRINHVKCDRKENGGDDKYYDDISYSDDDSILSQERFENSLKASGDKTTAIDDKKVEKDEKVHSNKDGPRILSSEEEIRYFLDPLDEGERDTSVSTETLIKTQDVRSLVTNQNTLLDNLGGMKRDIGNLDKEIDLIRSQIRSSAVINDATSNVKPLSKASSTGNLSSRKSLPLTTRSPNGKASAIRSNYVTSTMLPVVERSRVRYSVGGSVTPGSASVLGSAIKSNISRGYVPGSYMAGKSAVTAPGVRSAIIRPTTLPRVSSISSSARVRYIPVGTVTVTTRPRTYTTYRRPVYVDEWDDLDETAIGTYLSATSRPPHIGSFTNRIFESLHSASNLY